MQELSVTGLFGFTELEELRLVPVEITVKFDPHEMSIRLENPRILRCRWRHSVLLISDIVQLMNTTPEQLQLSSLHFASRITSGLK